MRKSSAVLISILTALTALVSVATASATLTQWPTCPAPPSGDYALCTQGAFPQSVVPGPDGAVWFTTARGNIGRATLAGGIAQYDLPGAGDVGLLGDLAVGPDGALWFPQYGASGLWSATIAAPPAFAYTDAGPAKTGPRGVALGPDGALWTAEARVDALGHYTPGGVFTQVTLPPRHAGAFVSSDDIIAGPDGRMWVDRDGVIDAVTMAGVVTEYPAPGALDALTVGPDGAIWFANYNGDSVGRITTAGVVTTFALPTHTRPASITTGPDGALWVGLGSGNGIMRLTTSGSWTITPLLFGSQVSSITTGPDGAIWFGDLGASRIGRLDVGLTADEVAVTSLSPSTGPTGTSVAVTGNDLRETTSVTVGGVTAIFHVDSNSLIHVTIPPGSGGTAVRVTGPDGSSPPTAASTFTYETVPGAAPAPAAPAPVVAPTAKIGVPVLSHSGVLTVAIKSTTRVPYVISAALTPSGAGAHIARRATLKIAHAGNAKGKLTRSGTTKLRLTLTTAARSALRTAGSHGARVELGVRLSLGGGQTSVGQRTVKLVLPRH